MKFIAAFFAFLTCQDWVVGRPSGYGDYSCRLQCSQSRDWNREVIQPDQEHQQHAANGQLDKIDAMKALDIQCKGREFFACLDDCSSGYGKVVSALNEVCLENRDAITESMPCLGRVEATTSHCTNLDAFSTHDATIRCRALNEMHSCTRPILARECGEDSAELLSKIAYSSAALLELQMGMTSGGGTCALDN